MPHTPGSGYGHSYAAERWAGAVAKVISGDGDPRTIGAWSRMVGVSSGSLVTWCRAARVSPRRSLELARLSRAVVITGGVFAELQEALDIVEPRTISRLLHRAGLPLHGKDGPRWSLGDFLNQQCLVRHDAALRALRAALDEGKSNAVTVPCHTGARP